MTSVRAASSITVIHFPHQRVWSPSNSIGRQSIPVVTVFNNSQINICLRYIQKTVPEPNYTSKSAARDSRDLAVGAARSTWVSLESHKSCARDSEPPPATELRLGPETKYQDSRPVVCGSKWSVVTWSSWYRRSQRWLARVGSYDTRELPSSRSHTSRAQPVPATSVFYDYVFHRMIHSFTIWARRSRCTVPCRAIALNLFAFPISHVTDVADSVRLVFN